MTASMVTASIKDRERPVRRKQAGNQPRSTKVSWCHLTAIFPEGEVGKLLTVKSFTNRRKK